MEEKIFFFNPNFNSFKEEKYLNEMVFTPRFGLENWIDQTYYLLKYKYGIQNLYLVNEIPSQGIIIFHSGHFFSFIKPNEDQLFICIAADYGRHRYAQVHLFQNHTQVHPLWNKKRILGDTLFSFCGNFHLAHWPQPNIIPRIRNRETRLKQIGYFGGVENIDNQLIDELKTFCGDKELDFRIENDWNKWNDYSEIDLVVAIRDFDQKLHGNKPYSKLLNSILAGVPVIAGNESSSRYFKKNYFQELPIVNSIEDLLHLLLEIERNYDVYLHDIQEIGKKRADFFEKKIPNDWIDMLLISCKLLKFWKQSAEWKKEIFFKYRDL